MHCNFKFLLIWSVTAEIPEKEIFLEVRRY